MCSHEIVLGMGTKTSRSWISTSVNFHSQPQKFSNEKSSTSTKTKQHEQESRREQRGRRSRIFSVELPGRRVNCARRLPARTRIHCQHNLPRHPSCFPLHPCDQFYKQKPCRLLINNVVTYFSGISTSVNFAPQPQNFSIEKSVTLKIMANVKL